MAAGVITGHVEAFEYTPGEGCTGVSSRPIHSESVRALRFQPDGAVLLSASADGMLAWTSVERRVLVGAVERAHECAINRLEVLSDTLAATGAPRLRQLCRLRLRDSRIRPDQLSRPGDDDGHVRLWDSRQRERVATFRVHEDFVADLHCGGARPHTLLSTSGDGTLAQTDLRARKVVARSDNQEDELLSGA